MATALSRAHRRDLAVLTGLAQKDLALMFRKFDTADATRDGLLEVLPALVAIYGAAAATLGADWYDDIRAEANVKGRFRAAPVELPDQGRTAALARWAVEPMYQAEPDAATTLAKVAGGLHRIVADADRQTVAAASIADPQARGWRRITAGGCPWCQMLAGRGEVYSQATVDFEAHDNDRCSSEPVFE